VRNLIYVLIGAVFFGAILAFMATYTVRFNEVAVKTTFGKAGPESVVTEAGLKFKWPYPAQQVIKYDKRLRVVETRSETQLTADEFQIIVVSFLTYRVSDPLIFFQRFGNAGDRSIDHFRRAEDVIRDRLRSAMGEVSKYRMGELFTPERGASKLAELEARVLEQVAAASEGGQGLTDYGIEVVGVGINRVRLPEDTTKTVIDRMAANRDKISKELESAGQSRSRAIIAQARADATKIREFARRRASEIEARGQLEAVPYLEAQNANAELAVFLQKLDLMREAMAKRITLILSVSDYGLDVFSPSTMDPSRINGGLPAPGASTTGVSE
jgi:membrane protease subunit HflC